MQIEVCCGHLESALLAEQGGADRIELCSSLPLGGLTPSPACIKLVKENLSIPVRVLIRPREGHFFYSRIEKQQILKEVEDSLNAGADGLVVGALNKDYSIDILFIKKIIKIARQTSLTFHRAFDFVEHPFLAMEQLQQLGFDYILTSGLQKTAREGKEVIRQLVEKSQGRISILPASGISPVNALELKNYCGVKALHLSAKELISYNNKNHPFDIDYWKVSPEILESLEMKLNP